MVPKNFWVKQEQGRTGGWALLATRLDVLDKGEKGHHSKYGPWGVAVASPGRWLEMLTLKPHPRPTEPELMSYQGYWLFSRHSEAWTLL